MIPRFSFTAYSGTGKTTYIEKLISCLRAMGLRVGAMKHDGHDFEIDKKGKDSWRFADAGADVVCIASKTKAAVMYYRPEPQEELLSRMTDVDLILIEGWHEEAENLICIWRSGCGMPMKVSPEQCIAVVSDVPPEGCTVPVFPLDDPEPLALWLRDKITAKES